MDTIRSEELVGKLSKPVAALYLAVVQAADAVLDQLMARRRVEGL